MFKVILLTFLVSVVWSTVRATYILDDSDSYGIFRNSKLGPYHGPIFQTHVNVDFGNHDHGIDIHHIPAQEVQYLPRRTTSFSPRLSQAPGDWKAVIPKHSNVFSHHRHIRPGISPQHVQIEPIFFSQHRLIDSSFLSQHPQTHPLQRVFQQQVEVKSNQENFRAPQIQHDAIYQTLHQNPKIPSGEIIKQSQFADYFRNNGGQINVAKGENQDLKNNEVHPSKSQEISQQKIINIEFKQLDDSKPESKISIKDSEEGHKTGTNDFSKHEQQNYNPPAEVKSLNHGNHGHQFILENNGKVLPIIYSQDHLAHGQYIKIDDDDHHERYVEIPLGYGSEGEVYREADISDGLGHIHHHSDLNPHHSVRLGHNSPILISGNYHENLNHHDRIILAVQTPLEGAINPDLKGSLAYALLGTNYSQTTEKDTQNEPEQKKDDSEDNYEQKPVMVELKSITQQTYDDTDDTSKIDKSDTSYKIEQKSVDVGIKGSPVSEDSYSSEDQQYKDGKDSDYPDTNSQKAGYNFEQKSVEVKIKSSKDNKEYDGIGSLSEYSESKNSGYDTQQKSVDVNYKSNDDDSVSEYPGIGSIDVPKYSDSKKVEQKLEQKSVETETYREIKASYKSSKETPISHGSSKDNSDYISSGVNDYKKDTDSKLSGYKTLGGATSTSYFNTGSLNSPYDSKRDNPLQYPSSDNNIRSTYTGSNYNSNLPRHASSYFSRKPSSHGSSINYHGSTPRIKNVQSHRDSFSSNHQRPFSHTGPTAPRINIFSHRPSNYGDNSRIPSHTGNRGISSDYNTPRHQTRFSGGISRPKYSNSPDQRNKFVKVNYEYPHSSVRKDEPIYASSLKPHDDRRSIPSSVRSYPSSSGKILNTLSGSDYSSGIGGIEYPGIGEKSSSDEKSTTYSSLKKSHVTEQKSYDEEQPLATIKTAELPITEQKAYNDEIPSVSYSAIKSEVSKPSETDYKGIGEIGSTSSSKSEIVGGRHPVRRPLKSIKTKSSGIKSKKDVKTEQTYLPITATLSDSDSKPTPKVYDSVKTKSPDKIEQQEDLSYEAFLAGEGPQNQATGSSGYGFDKPLAPSTGSAPHASGHGDEHAPPMPYEFQFDIKDDEHGSEQYREEKMDDSGYLTGRYGFRDGEGIYRQVEYEASKAGFKVNNIKTNEPGTDNDDPADVHFEVQNHQ